MVRLVIFLIFFAALILAGTAVLRFVSAAAGFNSRSAAHTATKKEDSMPALMRNIAYVLLLALMFGITTGWLGGL